VNALTRASETVFKFNCIMLVKTQIGILYFTMFLREANGYKRVLRTGEQCHCVCIPETVVWSS